MASQATQQQTNAEPHFARRPGLAAPSPLAPTAAAVFREHANALAGLGVPVYQRDGVGITSIEADAGGKAAKNARQITTEFHKLRGHLSEAGYRNVHVTHRSSHPKNHRPARHRIGTGTTISLSGPLMQEPPAATGPR